MTTNPVLDAVRAPRWNPYLVGVGIGLLSLASFVAFDRVIGTSGTFVHAVGAAEALVAPERVIGPEAERLFSKEISERAPLIDWQFLLVIGVFFGSWLASTAARARLPEQVPALWSWRFGPSVWLRRAGAFTFGVVMIFGARLAGGCTSGHGISGGLQLALSSWVFFLSMFASGIVAAFLMFGREGRSHVG